ncbi:MAG: hypothetical protein AAGF12_22345 [Myxococcota bacterium]
MGELHRYDGEVEPHRFVAKPRYYPPRDGAANPDGFLRVDFKDESRIRSHIGSGFNQYAGVFRGDIVAIEQIGPNDDHGDSCHERGSEVTTVLHPTPKSSRGVPDAMLLELR